MKIIKLVAGVLVGASLLAGPASATAAGPADVTVRVEDYGGTVLPRTAVRTTETPVVKDGTHSCPGTTAAGALELATGGDWSGTWSDSFGYGVDVIKGVSHRFFSGSYWAFYVEDTGQTTGICGRELSPGEDVLFVATSESGPAQPLLRLDDVPSGVVAPGQTVTVRVMRTRTVYESSPPYGASSVTEPAAGVKVEGHGILLTTDESGRASFVPASRGPVSLRATGSADVRSATETFCVSDGSDGACGSAVPAPAAPPAACRTNGFDGFCGTPDHRAAFGVVKSVKEGERFAARRGPRELEGVVEDEPSGIRSVRLRLVRNDRGRCARFDGDKLEFRRTKRCRATAGKWMTVGDTAAWKYLLPERLTRGRYVLDVEVRDRPGNVNRTWQRGRNRVVFHVG